MEQDSSNNTQQRTILQVPQGNRSTKKIILFGIIIVFISLIVIFIIINFNRQRSSNDNLFTQPTPTITNQNILSVTKQWVNCDDIRDIVEEDTKIYVACLGGVLIVDKNSGRVIDQISMAQGLGDSTATSLVKNGDLLFIGTQDGFTEFNLKSNQAKKISVEQGLINGANIVIAQDRNDLWVGSFGGLSKYNITTGQIQNFTQELVDNSTNYNATNILVTPNAVYVTILANAYAQGGIARWDKTQQKWERFGPSAFFDTQSEYRVDFFSSCTSGK